METETPPLNARQLRPCYPHTSSIFPENPQCFPVPQTPQHDEICCSLTYSPSSLSFLPISGKSYFYLPYSFTSQVGPNTHVASLYVLSLWLLIYFQYKLMYFSIESMLLLLRVREAFCPRRRPHSGPIEL